MAVLLRNPAICKASLMLLVDYSACTGIHAHVCSVDREVTGPVLRELHKYRSRWRSRSIDILSMLVSRVIPRSPHHPAVSTLSLSLSLSTIPLLWFVLYSQLCVRWGRQAGCCNAHDARSSAASCHKGAVMVLCPLPLTCKPAVCARMHAGSVCAEGRAG